MTYMAFKGTRKSSLFCGINYYKFKPNGRKEKFMNKMNVANEVAIEVAQKTGFICEVKEVAKHNETRLGIMVKESNSNIAPIIYIDDMIDCESDVEDIVDFVIRVYSEQREHMPMINANNILENLRDNVVPCLVAREGNENWLDDTVHEDFLDMCIYYRVNVASDSSFKVTPKILEEASLTVEELKECAMKNIGEPTIMGLFDVLIEMMGKDALMGMPRPEKEEQYVAKGTSDSQGANFLLLEDELRNFYEDNGAFYILPSSIHEVLLLPQNQQFEENALMDMVNEAREQFVVEKLKDMVREVNDTQVAPQDRLTYSVYLYDGNGISIAA